MEIRFAKEDELERVNVLRKQVNDLHVEGKPDVFKPGFNDDLRDHIYDIWNDPEQEIVVADVDEFYVDESFRRQGVATEIIAFIKDYTREKGFKRLELNMWEFNRGALEFYEAVGFKTFRRYMEVFV